MNVNLNKICSPDLFGSLLKVHAEEAGAARNNLSYNSGPVKILLFYVKLLFNFLKNYPNPN